MADQMVAFGIFSGLFALLFISVLAGRLVGKLRIAHDPSHKLEIISVAEGAIFALLGLLIAFTFTGAYERFEARKIHIIEEANAIDTAYLRLKLLNDNDRIELEKSFIDYVDSRISVYKTLSDINQTQQQIQSSSKLQEKIWDEVILSVKHTNNNAATMLVIPAINMMFEIANTRFAITKLHPPVAIFVLLISIAMISGFLAGYSAARKKLFRSVHIFTYIFITALTIYIIIDMELPRSGLIKVQNFDQILVHVRDALLNGSAA